MATDQPTGLDDPDVVRLMVFFALWNGQLPPELDGENLWKAFHVLTGMDLMRINATIRKATEAGMIEGGDASRWPVDFRPGRN